MQISSLLDVNGIFLPQEILALEDFFLLALKESGLSGEIIPLDALKKSMSWSDMGGGFFIPHTRLEDLEYPLLRAALLPSGFQENPGSPVFCIVLLSPMNQPDLHLQILSHLSWLMGKKGLLENILRARSPEEIFDLMKKAESSGTGGFSNLSKQEIFRELDSSPEGISPEESYRRLGIKGPNLLTQKKGIPWWVKLGRNFVSLFALMLWSAGILCFLPGVDMPQLGWAIFTVVVVNGVFSFWQEFKAEKAVEALQKLIPPMAMVVRAGVQLNINASLLVPGDIILLEEGNLVPADARLIETSELRVNNASLTGESRPIYKMSEPFPGPKSEGFLWTELPNMVFAGTSVTSGSGQAVVIGTGMDTEVGKIALLTQEVPRELSPLQKEMNTVVNIITALSLGIGVLFFLLGMGLAGLSFFSAFIFTIGITVANIPEGLMPTLSLALAMGVQRLARKNVLVKNLASVETLGSTTVICTDKTGTLTTNRISVVDLFKFGSPPGEGSTLLFLTAQLCNNARLKGDEVLGDPTEGALLVWAKDAGNITQEDTQKEFPRLAHFPFESVRKRMSTVHQGKNGPFVCAKGAPIELLDCCNRVSEGSGIRFLNPQDRVELQIQMDRMASLGLRTLGLAWKDLSEDTPTLPCSAGEAESGLCFLGLAGMEDPFRPEVPGAVALCLTAGIRLVMITGDYGITAQAIARKTGMTEEGRPGRFLTGAEVEKMDDGQLDRFLCQDKDTLVFSRMAPDQKMRIVTRFKAAREIVAVTGDGVNDAAALKKADIGIAMGTQANDVAKEAAAMLVLDGNFSSIVTAVEEGRAVYANIKRFVTYILASNMPELAPFVLFVLMKIPLALTVMQILAVDLGTDLVPALGLGVEPPEKGLMSKPPRKRTERLIDLPLFLRSYLWLGGMEIVFSLGAFFWSFLQSGWLPGQDLPSSGALYLKATTMTLGAIVFCQIGNVFACRTARQSIFSAGWTTNPLVLLGLGTELIILWILIYVPFFQKAFGLFPLTLQDWGTLCLLPPIFLTLEEGRKFILRKMGK